MVDDDPTSGEGFESAVAYAVAEQLRYAEDQVSWVRVRQIDGLVVDLPTAYFISNVELDGSVTRSRTGPASSSPG